MSDETLLADVLTEFLEIAIHSVLYVRNLYPRQIFALKKKYQIPVHVSTHPKVNEYITECLKTVRYLLETDSIKDVSVAVLDGCVLVEKYVFAFDLFGANADDAKDEDGYLVSVEEMFREFLLKLTVVEGGMERLSEDCSFCIQVTTSEQCYVKLNERGDLSHFPWVEAEESHKINPVHRILPVKSARCSMFFLNVYVEK